MTVLCVSCSYNSFSQSQGSAVLEADKTSISAVNGEVTGILIKVKNTSKKGINTSLEIEAGKEIESFSARSIPVPLAASDSVFMPVKFRVLQKALAGAEHELKITLREKDSVIAELRCKVKVTVKKAVNLTALVSNILVDNPNQPIVIPVRVQNAGNTLRKVIIINSCSSLPSETGFYKPLELSIPAFTDTIINFNRPFSKEMLKSDGIDINFKGLYSDGEMFGMASVHIQNPKSNLRYSMASSTGEPNTITFTGRNLLSAFENYELTGYGNIETTKGKIGYSADASFWKNSSLPAVVRDTWLSYSTGGLTISGGNLSRNLDINLNGRGVSFAYRSSDRNSFETGFIKSIPVLWGYTYSLYTPGNAGWATFQHTGSKWEIKNSVICNVDPQSGSKNILLLNNIGLNMGKFRYTLTINPGRTRSYSNGGTDKNVWGAGLTITGRAGNFSMSSSNFASSAYYPGLRRGAVDLSERVSVSGRKVSWWGQGSYYSYKPLYFNAFLPSSSKSETINSETGISWIVSRNTNISISPNYHCENGSSFYFSAFNKSSLKTFRLNSLIHCNTNSDKFFSLNADAGFSHYSPDSANHFQLRLNGVYRWSSFNLNVSYQSGNFFLAEALANHYRGISGTKLLNVSPAITRTVCKGKGRIDAGLTYIKQAHSSDNLLFRGEFGYNISGGTKLFAGINYNQYYYTGSKYTYNTFEAGITQKIATPCITAHSSSLEVFLFKDNNQNGSYDQGVDSVATNCLVYINNTPFVSDHEGCVRYTNLPESDYEVSVVNTGGWYAASQFVRPKKKTQINIALQKNGSVRGKIAYTAGKLSYETSQEKLGIAVTARGDNGLVYTTKTDDKGNFTFFLPQGVYTVFVNSENLPEQVDCANNNQKITVNADISDTINFELKIKSRHADVQRFVSPSLSSVKK